MYYLIFIGKCKKPYCELEKYFTKLVSRIAKVYYVDSIEKALKLASKLKEKTGYEIYILDSEGEILDLNRIKEGIIITGPAEGFSEEIKRKFKTLSLSPLEFNHLLARILLLEQIYRKINPHYSK